MLRVECPQDLPNTPKSFDHLFEEFVRSYLAAALWSSTDDDHDPLDDNYSPEDIAETTLVLLREDCRKFWDANRERIWSRPETAGIDFWLTRNGHGSGFWDGDWPEDGDALTESADSFGEFSLFVGDDGLIYC